MEIIINNEKKIIKNLNISFSNEYEIDFFNFEVSDKEDFSFYENLKNNKTINIKVFNKSYDLTLLNIFILDNKILIIGKE